MLMKERETNKDSYCKKEVMARNFAVVDLKKVCCSRNSGIMHTEMCFGVVFR